MSGSTAMAFARRFAMALACTVAAALSCGAAPRVPTSDDVIVETLPTIAGWSREERRLRRELAQRSGDPAAAVALAQAYLELARTQGDARYAGRALGALQAWQASTPMQTPPAVLVMRATIAQFMHDFDGAEATLKTALALQPADAQAWITLAAVLRVRGRYAESDAACRALGRHAPALYAAACLAENAGLRGDAASARNALQGLLSAPELQGKAQAGTRRWLFTSLAQVEELAGQPAAAETAYRQALQLEREGYALLAYSDFLLLHNRPAEVPPLLALQPRSDAVLLRLAIAQRREQINVPGTAVAKAGAQRDADELQARLDIAALRPGSAAVHAREGAMFALDVQGDAPRALALARSNVALQREPIDLLLLARAAAAARNGEALRAARAMAREMGLRDARVDTLG